MVPVWNRIALPVGVLGQALGVLRPGIVSL